MPLRAADVLGFRRHVSKVTETEVEEASGVPRGEIFLERRLGSCADRSGASLTRYPGHTRHRDGARVRRAQRRGAAVEIDGDDEVIDLAALARISTPIGCQTPALPVDAWAF
jgi:hypothetical protein